MPEPRTIDDLDHAELAELAREHLLAGHLIDRAGMPVVMEHGLESMRDVAIDEWMGASPIYAKRMQRLLDFEGDTVDVALKGMQLDIGAPPEFMDFRYTVHDDHHAEFHLDHCGALMDVEPMGEEFVVAMCHAIEDPTFDATGWATNKRLRMRPVHRPPRAPADRHPHCAWTVEIDLEADETPTPEPAMRIALTAAANLPLAEARGDTADGENDYTRPLDPDLRLDAFSSGTLRAIVDEVCLQGQLLSLAFAQAVEDRFGKQTAVDAVRRQLTGVAGVAAERLAKAFGLGDEADDLAMVFELHPAFHPRTYVDWRVAVEGDGVCLELGDCPATTEGITGWMGLLTAGDDLALTSIAAGVDPRWVAHRDGPGRWIVERGPEPAPELSEVVLTKISTGAAFRFVR